MYILPFIQWSKQESTVLLSNQRMDAQQREKQKRKVEGKLHLKRQERCAIAIPLVCFVILDKFLDPGRHQALSTLNSVRRNCLRIWSISRYVHCMYVTHFRLLLDGTELRQHYPKFKSAIFHPYIYKSFWGPLLEV